jgi:hypothetical protein
MPRKNAYCPRLLIIDASTDKELNRPNIPPPEELPEQTERQLLPKIQIDKSEKEGMPLRCNGL